MRKLVPLVGFIIALLCCSEANAIAPSDCWVREPTKHRSRIVPPEKLNKPQPPRYGYRLVKIRVSAKHVGNEDRWKFICLLEPVDEFITILVFDGVPPVSGQVPLETMPIAAINKKPKDDSFLTEHRFGLPISSGGGYRPRHEIVSSIPEPQTWALMLVGFGLLGHALRQRRNKPVTPS